ncbi:diguanylate cyclase [Cetobacterium sp.]|uniref:diguanylate cyclase n=3 Tax=Cetobacterium sp. TaxID=2071632 RepID=UPI003F33FB0C
MKTKFYNIFITLSTCLLTLSLIFFTVAGVKTIKQEKISFLKNINNSNNNLNFNTLSPLEKEVLNKFKKIPKNEYSYKYREIAENNRPLLDLHLEDNIGVYILKTLLNSNQLSSEQRLYILNKLRVIDSLSGNIVNTIKITIEYLNLAEELNSEYDIARAKIGLSSIISSLGGYETAITLLENINFNDKQFLLINRIKISYYFHLAENYYFIDNYKEAFKYLDKISNLLEGEPEEYKVNILLLKNLLKTQIYLKLKNSQEALNNLNLSKNLLDNLQKVYFSDLKIFYLLTLESYNLKYNFQNFNENYLKNFIETSQETGDVIFLKMAFDLLFEYYFESNDFIKYRKLDLMYISYLKKITNGNNKFFTLYLVENLENEYISMENKKLYTHISIILLVSLIILIISFKRTQYLDKKTKIDVLTNIGNRLAFNIKLKELENKNYYMLLFDIDNFKRLNDTYGHDFGDKVLSTVGKILKTIENKEISIYRVGGEEFLIIFTNLNKNFCIDSCEYIRKSIENIKWENPVTVTISGGFSQKSENTYIKCDSRLYKAKNSGKNLIIYQKI